MRLNKNNPLKIKGLVIDYGVQGDRTLGLYLAKVALSQLS